MAVNWLHIETNERKNLSLLMMFGGALVFTVYAAIGLWLVSGVAKYVFWLAVIAHVQIFSIMTGYIAQLVKRRISASKSGITIEDEGTAKFESVTTSTQVSTTQG